MASMRNEARASSKAKMGRMLGASNNPVAKEATKYATLGQDMQAVEHQKVPTRASGGRVGGEKSAPRLDRAKGKGGAKTNVNVIVAGKGEDKPVPVPVPAAGASPAPPPRPPMPPAGGPPMPMRARGGKITAGDNGVGRLQKAAAQRKTYP